MKHVIDDETGTDFGVDVSGLRNKIDLWEAPLEAIDARPDPAVVKRLNVVSLKDTIKADGSALRAAKSEVEAPSEKAASITFEFEGDKYTISPTSEWPLEVFEAGEDGLLVTPVRELLGAKQWKFFKAKKQRTLADLDALFDAAQNAGGINPGESDA